MTASCALEEKTQICVYYSSKHWLIITARRMAVSFPYRLPITLYGAVVFGDILLVSCGRPPEVSHLFASVAATFQRLCVCMHKLLTLGLFMHASRTSTNVEIGLSSLNISCA